MSTELKVKQEPKSPRVRNPRTPRTRKAPTTPRKRKTHPMAGTIWWGPEADGKNPLKDYIRPSDKLRVCANLEAAYKFMLQNTRMTLKKYNYIQAARLYYHDHGECPPDMNDLMR